MRKANNKQLETIIYVCLCLVVIIMYVLDTLGDRSTSGLPLLDIKVITGQTVKLLTFILLFVINNYILIPKLLKRGRYGHFFLFSLITIAIVWGWQHVQFHLAIEDMPHPARPPHHGPTHLLPLPVFLDLIYDLLIVGGNLAVSLIFQQFADHLKHESLMKENAENQLTYLRAQINPHFYMNMLNNIHGMIEIDATKAQEMVIEMSSLMRYMLYDGSKSEIEVAAEIKFIKDYLALMSERFPADIVKIRAEMPAAKEVAGCKIPPLLFIVFLENAFKHGISYSHQSFVTVSLALDSEGIVFKCCNSLQTGAKEGQSDGIGLENIKRRLDIIYDKKYTLKIRKTDSTYTVTLILPPYETETQNIDN